MEIIKKRKIEAIFILIVMLAQIFLPVIIDIDFTSISNAAEANVNGIYWIYDIEDGKIVNLKPKDRTQIIGEIEIPSQIDGKPVTRIGAYAFGSCTSLSTITIPSSVTSIGDSAFYNCTSLSKITIPESVTSIGDSAFRGCTSLSTIEVDNNNTIYTSKEGVLFNKNETVLIKYPEGNENENYIIPGSVTSIGASAFYNCTNLSTVTIPSSVRNIGNNAFSYCTSLTKITIPSSVTNIGSAAFYNCTKLSEITIPESVTSIGASAFYYCEKLSEITIPESVTSIGDFAFSGCRSLSTITIPESVTSIGDYAFYYCTNLSTVTISSGVTSIGDFAFSGCRSLSIITIPESVISIGVSAFYNCTKLTEITIPESVTSIGAHAFSYCNSLKIYCYSGSSAEKYAKANIIKYEIITAETKALIGISVTTSSTKTSYIEGQNFDKTGMKVTATYNDGSTKEIANYIVTNGANLTTEKTSVTIIYLEKGVIKTATQNINVIAKALTGIEITTAPRKIDYIEGQNFDKEGMKVTATYNDGSTEEKADSEVTVTDGSSLAIGKTSVTISYTENGIIKTATQNINVIAKELTEIKVTTAPTKTSYIAGQNFDKAGMKVTATYNDGSTKEIADSEVTVTDGSSLAIGKTSVIISYTENGITKTAIQKITVLKALTEIKVTTAQTKTDYVVGEDFDKKGMKVIATYNDGSTKEIADSEVTVTDGENLTLEKTSVTISYTENGITKTAPQNIIVVKEGEGIKFKDGENGTYTYKIISEDKKTISIVKYEEGTVQEITIPSKIDKYTITNIGNNAFRGCTSLSKITIPESVTSIGGYSFYCCTKLTEITIPESVTSIGVYVFSGCNSLKIYCYSGSSAEKYAKANNIKVIAKELTGIEITTAPRIDYIAGQSFDKAGIIVKATYNDGSTEEKADSEVTVTDGSSLAIDKTSVTISYTENGITKTATQNIKVIAKELTGIEITTAPRIDYIAGQSFDKAGIIVKATYNDGSIEEKADSEVTVTDGSSLAISKTSVTISYTENGITKTATQNIKVIAKELTGIEITTAPRIDYIAGQSFDKAGIIVKATYNDGSTEEKADSEVTVTDGSSLAISKTSVTISYTENGITKTAPQNIIVVKEGEGIIFKDGENGTYTYKIISEDKKTISIVKYEKGTVQEITIPSKIKEYTITNIGSYAFESCTSLTKITIPESVTSIGRYAFSDCTSLSTITIPESVTSIGAYAFSGCNLLKIYCYSGSSAEKYAKANNIKVIAKELTGIEITTAPRIDYIAGQSFDKAGIIVKATYNDGSTEEKADSEVTVTDGSSLAIDKTSVTISYTENGITKTATQNIKIIAKELTEIKVTTAPTKTSYIAGQSFDKTGMKVTATYNDGSTREITNYTVIDGTNLTTGKTSVTIKYIENVVTKTATQNITVVKEIAAIDVKLKQDSIYKTEEGQIINIQPKTKIEELINSLIINEEGTTTKIYENTREVKKDDIIKTGQKVVVTKEEKKVEYVLVVVGDVNGTGTVNVSDITTVMMHMAEEIAMKQDTTKILTGAYLKASNTNNDSKVNITDLTLLMKMVAESK